VRFDAGSDVRRNVENQIDRFSFHPGFPEGDGEVTQEMRTLLLNLTAGLCLTFTASATTVQYSLSATATPNEYTYLFTTNAVLQQNQGLVIQFPWANVAPRFTNLENTVGGVGLIILHQPNATPLAPGDITLLVGTNNTPVPNFSLEATYEGAAWPLTTGTPGSLPFQILQFDGSTSGALVTGTVETGTALLASSGVPEPSSGLLSLAGLLVAGTYLAVRRC